jgi:hypothetical protein
LIASAFAGILFLEKNMTDTIKALEILGMYSYRIYPSGQGNHFISKKTGRHYSVQPSGNIRGYSHRSSWKIGTGGLEEFLKKVISQPKRYLGV